MRSLLILLCTCLMSVKAYSQCHPQYNDSELLQLKNKGFHLKDSEHLHEFIVGLPACLSHPNPVIRDGVVFEAMSQLIRAKVIEPETLQVLFSNLIQRLKITNHNALQAEQPQDENFEKPFAALVLSEVVRADRISPYLRKEQRVEAVATIANYMESIEDYRGFNDVEGWRHAVAHSADVMLQLALNKTLSPAHIHQLLDALQSQISPKDHFYHYGEPKRLAIAFIYLVFREGISLENIKERLEEIAAPAPLKQWSDAYKSNTGLAHMHNNRAFLLELSVLSSNREQEKLIAINEHVRALLRNTQ